MADAALNRHKSSSNTISADWISDLPESLISYILSSMPTKDAVATSILSRSWRFRWTKVTSFEFDNIGSNSKNQTFAGDEAVQATDLVESVNLVLLNHCGESVNKFLLRWESSKFRPIYLNTWANIVVTRNVRVLDLKTVNTENRPGAHCEFYLPSLLYTSGTLEALMLEGPFRVKPPNAVCLPKLTKMKLTEVIYESDEAIHRLISGCPILETLTINRLNKKDNLKVCCICSPSLKSLHLLFSDKSKGANSDMKLNIDAPLLEKLGIVDSMSSHISIRQIVLASLRKVVFGAPRLAPNLTVGLMKTFSSVTCFLALNSVGTMPVKPSFERLARLLILHPRWSGLIDLLDGCSVLEELGILCLDEDPWRDPARVPRCLSSLRRITFGKFDGFKKEMAVLKFFLDHCLALQSVGICCEGERSDVDEAKRLEILNKVSKLSRASPACKITCIEFSAMID